ncbi:MAG TPA: iron-sulfur cluster assembly scaffold protein [Sphingomonas sp.]
MTPPLYGTDILRLAASIPHQGRLADPMGSSERRSPVCGSRITIDLDLDEDGRVRAAGLDVRACALGQASASLLASEVVGRRPEEIAAARDALARWLAEGGDAPDWPGLAVFEAARPHTARHPSILLAFDAATEAAERAVAMARAG